MLGLLWVLVCWKWFRNEPREMKGISEEEKERIEKNRNYVKHERGFSWKLIFRNPMLWILFLSYFCIQWTNYFFVAWMPNYLQEGKHFTEHQMQTTTSLVFATGIPSAFIFGILSDWLIKRKGNVFSRRYISMVSFGIMALAVFLATLTSDHTLVTICFLFAVFPLVIIVLTCFSTCVDIGGDRVSTITGIMNFCGQSGAFLMSVFFGKTADLMHSYEAPQYIMAALLVLGGLCWFKIDASKKIIAEPVIALAY